ALQALSSVITVLALLSCVFLLVVRRTPGATLLPYTTLFRSGLLPADRIQRAHCRSISGEVHSGFTTLRASLPVNLKGQCARWMRSEEHTSELQSRENLVCRLLLEKKKNEKTWQLKSTLTS